MIPVTEKRRHPRIDLAVPVKLLESGSASQSRVLVGNAVSLNVSAGGVYLRTFTIPRLSTGLRVGLWITVPESIMLGEKRLSREAEYLNATLQGTGRIVRLEQVITADVVGIGVAVEFDKALEFSRSL